MTKDNSYYITKCISWKHLQSTRTKDKKQHCLGMCFSEDLKLVKDMKKDKELHKENVVRIMIDHVHTEFQN